MKTPLLPLLMFYAAGTLALASESVCDKNPVLKLPDNLNPEKLLAEIGSKQLQLLDRVKTPQDAIRKGDAEKLREFLLDGAELTPDLLIAAAKDNQTECIRVLLDLGLSPNAPDDESQNALHLCAAYGYAEGVKLLLDAGADINMLSPAHGGATPLMLAAKNNHTECAVLLVEAGADVYLRATEWDYTALHWAIDSEALDAFRYLLSVEKIRSDKALMQELFAPMPPNVEVLRLLMDVGATTGNAWVDAVCYGDEQKLQELLRTDECKTVDNKDVLSMAILLHGPHITRYVLQTGVDVTHFPRDAGWQITRVVRPGKTEHLKMLIEKGMDVNETCADWNHSLLIEAVFRGCDAAVELLLKSGADINARDANGYTALMFAYTSPEKVKLLLAANPDLSLRNKDGEDAAEVFRSWVIYGESAAESYRLLQEYMQKK